jgi:hypothetical protein
MTNLKNDELQTMWKVAVTADLKALFRNLEGLRKPTYLVSRNTVCPDRNFNRSPPKYKSEEGMTCFLGAVNRNNFYFIILLFTSLHVSASTGHLQVKYTQSFFKSYYAYNGSVLGYTVHYFIFVCNIL